MVIVKLKVVNRGYTVWKRERLVRERNLVRELVIVGCFSLNFFEVRDLMKFLVIVGYEGVFVWRR